MGTFGDAIELIARIIVAIPFRKARRSNLGSPATFKEAVETVRRYLALTLTRHYLAIPWLDRSGRPGMRASFSSA